MNNINKINPETPIKQRGAQKSEVIFTTYNGGGLMGVTPYFLMILNSYIIKYRSCDPVTPIGKNNFSEGGHGVTFPVPAYLYRRNNYVFKRDLFVTSPYLTY